MRHIITLLMLVALLPWGAYVAAQSARAARSAQGVMPHVMTLVSAGEAPATDSRAANPAPSQTIALAPRKCRTATLPGFSCSPDPAIRMMSAAAGSPSRSATVFRPANDWTGASAAKAPPTGPPRSI
ncbi:MAG: hypothetical protein Q8Q26_12650 [Pseudorhodobacter sp.]|nr:hypothetical protein [Pseudorhodobacter sp.]